MIQLIKIGENEYRFDGVIPYRKDISETITVNGKKYVYDECIVLDLILSDAWINDREHWYEWDIDDFKCFGFQDIRIWNYCGLLYSTADWFALHWGESQNSFIAICYELARLKHFGNWSISSGKNDKLYRREFYENSKISIPVCQYGFNNWMFIDMDLFDFMSLDFSKLTYHPKHFIEELINRNQLPINTFELSIIPDDVLIDWGLSKFKGKILVSNNIY